MPVTSCPRWRKACARRAQRARRSVAAGAGAGAKFDADSLLAHKEEDFEDALVRASGLTVDAFADRETAAPGESLRVTVQTYLPVVDPGRWCRHERGDERRQERWRWRRRWCERRGWQVGGIERIRFHSFAQLRRARGGSCRSSAPHR